jgi:hypothetical protein
MVWVLRSVKPEGWRFWVVIVLPVPGTGDVGVGGLRPGNIVVIAPAMPLVGARSVLVRVSPILTTPGVPELMVGFGCVRTGGLYAVASVSGRIIGCTSR